MPDPIARAIMAQVKRQKGCNLNDLKHALPAWPDRYFATDNEPEYFLREPLVRLLKWNLIQAWDAGQLLDPQVLDERDKYSLRSRDLTFYLSPVAAMMEEVLDVDLSGRPPSIFGDPLDHEETRWPDLFVLMPFKKELKPVFDDHVKTVAERAGLTVGRADDFFSTGSIVRQIWSAIVHARVVLADCTDRNPNVFYEIGVAHAIGKDTVLISQSIDDVPFDLRHLRVLLYDFTPRGMAAFETQLAATLGGPKSPTVHARRHAKDGQSRASKKTRIEGGRKRSRSRRRR